MSSSKSRLSNCGEGFGNGSGDVSDSDKDGSSSDASSHHMSDPEAFGYTKMVNERSHSASDSELEHVEGIEQRCRFVAMTPSSHLGNSYDEIIYPEDSPPTSDESRSIYPYDDGKTESCSKVLYSSDPVVPVVEQRYLPDVECTEERQVVTDTEYDEAHVAVSSSPEVSPRDGGLQRSVGLYPYHNKFSRHFSVESANLKQTSTASTSTTSVDESIKFPLTSLQDTIGGLKQRSSQFKETSSFVERPSDHRCRSDPLTTQSHYGNFAHKYASQKNLPATRISSSLRNDDDCCRVPIENEQVLHKGTSSVHTQDADPTLRGLDSSYGGRHSRPVTSHSEISGDTSHYNPRLNQMPGYDDRYGTVDSLENQHPDRNVGGPFSGSSSMGSSGMDGRSTMTPEPPAESSSFSKKKKKRKIKAEHEKSAWSKANDLPGHVGDKDVDEILAYLGEDNSASIENVKKKGKKEKKKGNLANPVMKKEHQSAAPLNAANKIEDISCNTNKKSLSAAMANQKSESSVVLQSGCKSAIIKTTSKHGPVSRIILHGADNVKDKTLNNNCDGADYSERNIDEEIEKSLRNGILSEPLSGSVAVVPLSGSAAVEPLSRPVIGEPFSLPVTIEPASGVVAEHVSPSLSADGRSRAAGQIVDVTYHTDLDLEWVEKEFMRLATPEPAEEEFKEVVHKKKKGYSKSQSERDVAASTVPSATSVRNPAKPLNKLSARPKHAAIANPAHHHSASPHNTDTPKAKEYKTNAKVTLTDEAQYDLSERSFPTLFGEHKIASGPAENAIRPSLAPTWAAKVASKKLSPPSRQLHPQSPPAKEGDGEVREVVAVTTTVNVSVTETPNKPVVEELQTFPVSVNVKSALVQNTENRTCGANSMSESIMGSESSVTIKPIETDCGTPDVSSHEDTRFSAAFSSRAPLGTAPSGMGSSCVVPSSIVPPGTTPSVTGSSSMVPSSIGPPGTAPSATGSSSTVPSSIVPPGTVPSAITPFTTASSSTLHSDPTHYDTTSCDMASSDMALTSINNPRPPAEIDGPAPAVHAHPAHDAEDTSLTGTKLKIVQRMGRPYRAEQAPGSQIEFGFGIDDEILSTTSLSRFREGTAEGPDAKLADTPGLAETSNYTAGPADTSNYTPPGRIGVNILPQLLSMSASSAQASRPRADSVTSETYPEDLRNCVRMLRREWTLVQNELHGRSPRKHQSGDRRRRRSAVVYWSEDMD